MSLVHRRGHRLRHPRREHDPVLHLLLHVRLPADRRPDLGRRRHALPGLPDRRHRGPHHAGRRGAAAPGRPQPPAGLHPSPRRGLRPGLRLRAGGDHARRASAACTSSRRTSATTSRWERALRHARDARGRARRASSRALYRFRARRRRRSETRRVKLLGSGAILNEVLQGRRRCCEDEYGVESDVWSVTSYKQLHRDGLDVERWNRLHPGEKPRVPYVRAVLRRANPAVWSSRPRTTSRRCPIRSAVGRRRVRRRWAPTVSAAARAATALRDFFEVDAALHRLRDPGGAWPGRGRFETKTAGGRRVKKLEIDPTKPNPTVLNRTDPEER